MKFLILLVVPGDVHHLSL